MAESATLEQATSDAPETLVSDDSLQATAAAEELDNGDVEPSIEPDAQDTTPELSPQEDYAALVEKADTWSKGEEGAEPLSTEEKTRLRGYEQSIADRQRADQQARFLQRQNREKLDKLHSEAPDRVLSHVQTELDAAVAEGRNVSPTLLKNAVSSEVSAILRDAAPLVLREHTDGLRSYALELMDTPAVRDKLSDTLDFQSTLQLALDVSYSRGLQDSPAAKEVAKKDAEIVKLKGEIQKLKGDRGSKGSGASTEGKESSAKPMPKSVEEWAQYWTTDPEGARQR